MTSQKTAAEETTKVLTTLKIVAFSSRIKLHKVIVELRLWIVDQHNKGLCITLTLLYKKRITESLIAQFRYIKIQPKTIDLSTRLVGINLTNSVVIPTSLVLRSIVLG